MHTAVSTVTVASSLHQIGQREFLSVPSVSFVVVGDAQSGKLPFVSGKILCPFLASASLLLLLFLPQVTTRVTYGCMEQKCSLLSPKCTLALRT